jgi:hypothetical protein
MHPRISYHKNPNFDNEHNASHKQHILIIRYLCRSSKVKKIWSKDLNSCRPRPLSKKKQSSWDSPKTGYVQTKSSEDDLEIAAAFTGSEKGKESESDADNPIRDVIRFGKGWLPILKSRRIKYWCSILTPLKQRVDSSRKFRHLVQLFRKPLPGEVSWSWCW